MDSFSVISLTSYCTNISHVAISASIDLTELTQELPPGPRAERLSARLLAFSGFLEQFGHTAAQLERRLEGHGIVMSPALQSRLNTWLGACQGSIAALNKQLSRLEPQNATGLDWDYLVLQRDLLVAYTQLLVYFEELLGVDETETQDSILDGPDARSIIEQVEQTSRHASKVPPDILPGSVGKDSAKSPTSTSPGALNTDDPPPPYEAAVHSPDLSISPAAARDSKPRLPRSDSQQSSQSSTAVSPLDFTSLDLSTLRYGFRALTSRLGWFRPDPLANALCEASRRGDLQQIAGIIQQGANVDGRNEDGRSPLSCAIATDQVAAVRMLLAAGADAHSTPSISGARWPPLFVAAQAESLSVAALFVEKGASPREKSMSGQQYFYDLVSSCAGEKDSGLQGIRFLLERGASPDASSLSGRKAVISAAKRGRVDLMKLLLDHGASAKTNDYTGNSLLTIALDQADSIEMAELILNRGGSPNSTSTTGNPVLADAVSRRNVPFAQLLLAAGAKATGCDYTGQPIIVNVIRDTKLTDEDKTELVRLLLQNGASALTKDQGWDTPVLHYAVEKANANVVSLLMENGADASIYRKGEPLLFSAIQSGKPGMAEALLRNGASANVIDSKGNSPMMGALMKQDLELVRLLRRYQGEVDVAPQEYARALGRADMLEALGLAPEGVTQEAK